MTDFLYKVAGRLSLVLQLSHRVLQKDKPNTNGELDKTGLTKNKAQKIGSLYRDGKIIFPDYDNLPHALWRSQELSLFNIHRQWINPPVLDLGCGDGAFSSMLFNKIEFGADYDPEALGIAGQREVYNQLVQSTNSEIPIDNETVATVISNSAFEHFADLNAMIKEVHRMLKKDGRLIFTVPVFQFARDLSKFFGAKESSKINIEYYHRNLFTVEQWANTLSANGFRIEMMSQYQYGKFTFWQRILKLTLPTGFFLKHLALKSIIWNLFRSRILNMVRKSVMCTDVGANAFIVATKIGAHEENISRGLSGA